jgi:hypothetical protein
VEEESGGHRRPWVEDPSSVDIPAAMTPPPSSTVHLFFSDVSPRILAYRTQNVAGHKFPSGQLEETVGSPIANFSEGLPPCTVQTVHGSAFLPESS